MISQVSTTWYLYAYTAAVVVHTAVAHVAWRDPMYVMHDLQHQYPSGLSLYVCTTIYAGPAQLLTRAGEGLLTDHLLLIIVVLL